MFSIVIIFDSKLGVANLIKHEFTVTFTIKFLISSLFNLYFQNKHFSLIFKKAYIISDDLKSKKAFNSLRTQNSLIMDVDRLN